MANSKTAHAHSVWQTHVGHETWLLCLLVRNYDGMLSLRSNCFPFIAHFAVTITTYFTFLKICISLFARPAPAMTQIPTRIESNWTDVPTEKINAKV